MSPEEFWQWFAGDSDRIASDPTNKKIIKELDKRVSLTWPQLAWEIGPDPLGGWYLAISPNLDRSLIEQARVAIQAAPEVHGWRFYPARQRKVWEGKFQFEGRDGIRHVDSTNWRYVLLRYPDSERELVLIAQEAERLDPDERWHAAAIVIEGMIGEDCFLSQADSFDLAPTLDEEMLAKSKPIQSLPVAFGLTE